MKTDNTVEESPISDIMEGLLKDLSKLKDKVRVLELKLKLKGVPCLNLDVINKEK